MLSLFTIVVTFWVLSVAAATNQTMGPLPPTVELMALHAHTFTPLGCIISSGNFTTNTIACSLFRTFPSSQPNLSKLTMAGTPCGMKHTLTCPGADGEVGVFTELDGLLGAVLPGTTETRFSVDTMTGGGLNSVGLPIGVPLIVGPHGRIKLVLQVKAVSG